jgi:hypothetical protein
VARLLLIVSRTEPARYTYLKYVFASETVDVILDRRVGERRQNMARAAIDRRHTDRRERDLAKDLQTFGWALVRH